ncbi:MAG: ribosome silencing factor [Verrucomicrobiota bacterium]
MIEPLDLQIAHDCVEWADDKKAEDIVLLDLSELDGPALLFLICHGQSTPQLKAIVDSIESGMSEKHQLKPFARDGKRSSDWMVLDYGALMVHILSKEMRDKYELEELWCDSEKIDLKL